MAFLFKSKKNQNSGALPPAARNIHTSEGTGTNTTSALVNGSKEREKDGGAVQSPTPPNASVNNSLNSVSAGPGSPDQPRFRQRAESESQVSNILFFYFFIFLIFPNPTLPDFADGKSNPWHAHLPSGFRPLT